MTIALSPKPLLEREALRDVIDLALWAGQMLLQHGAETARIEETVHRLGTGLGADWMDILVSPNAIAVTTVSGPEFRTKIRRVVAMGVNMSVITEVNRISRAVQGGTLDRHAVRQELRKLDARLPHYNRWLTVGMAGIACAAFSQLFGGDLPILIVTFCASAIAMFVRQELNRRYFNFLLVTICTAFVATLIASTATLFQLSPRPSIALSASVLLLVPGIHLINAAEDLIKGHLVTGLVRGILGGLISLAIAVGLALALRVLGLSGL
jgi:uncharacterized membrane protein YjjP (DUF1212 family)